MCMSSRTEWSGNRRTTFNIYRNAAIYNGTRNWNIFVIRFKNAIVVQLEIIMENVMTPFTGIA